MKELTKLIRILSSYGLWNSASEIKKLAEGASGVGYGNNWG